MFVQADVSDGTAVQGLIQTIIERYDRLDYASITLALAASLARWSKAAAKPGIR